MHETTRITVRDTPVDLLRDGSGPALLYLHGAGAGGRWLAFQERLAERFTVLAPSHPGHGASPAAEWIEHVSDLAFHYLDLLDTLGLERVHVVGASFGGWIAAEMATMASLRLASMTLIDPVGIKVEGWIYPFLFGVELPQLVATVFHNPFAAIALAPPDMSIDTLALLYRQNTALARVAWNPYLYNPLLRRRLARVALAAPASAHALMSVRSGRRGQGGHDDSEQDCQDSRHRPNRSPRKRGGGTVAPALDAALCGLFQRPLLTRSQFRATRSRRSATTRSRPRPQLIRSRAPFLASTRSLPVPPDMRLRPEPPFSTSAPERPRSTSAPRPPKSRSAPVPP